VPAPEDLRGFARADGLFSCLPRPPLVELAASWLQGLRAGEVRDRTAAPSAFLRWLRGCGALATMLRGWGARDVPLTEQI